MEALGKEESGEEDLLSPLPNGPKKPKGLKGHPPLVKNALFRLNMKSVDKRMYNGPRSAQQYKSPQKSPFTAAPKSAFLYPPYLTDLSPNLHSQHLSPTILHGRQQSLSPPQPLGVVESSRFTPYPSPLDQHSPRAPNPVQAFFHETASSSYPPRFQRIETANLPSYSQSTPHSSIELRHVEQDFTFSEYLPQDSFLPNMDPLSIKSVRHPESQQEYLDLHTLKSQQHFLSSRQENHENYPATTIESNKFSFPDGIPAKEASYDAYPDRVSSHDEMTEISNDYQKFMDWIKN